ncbi:hypothetical protein ACJ4V0_10525 [Phreatobacter sp. HK31-P]
MSVISDGTTEADVEIRAIIPLLTRSETLAIPIEDIRSKEQISARDIGKGQKRKVGYVPDFTIHKKSLPVAVIEAKAPSADVTLAYAEARLYALEINRNFPSGINPCCRILATNGQNVLAGKWDAEPELIVSLGELSPGSNALDKLIALLGTKTLDILADNASQALRFSDFKRPFNQGAGPTQIGSRIEPNSFAADISPILRRYFSSRDQTTDPDIYGRAYISSNEVTSYDRILESFLKDRLSRAKRRLEVTTSKRKSDSISNRLSTFDRSKPPTGDLQIITGGVGVGKSLFARRYKEFLQPSALAGRNHWAFLDFNSAPEDFLQWQDWVCAQFAKSIQEEGAPVNLRDAADQERVFADDLADRSAYYQRMNSIGAGRGELERARDIEQWRQDAARLTRGISRYLQGDRGENLIVVFDNVDRREPAAQLAAFQTALWFMDQTRCLVVLQMRDSTFESFKNSPPLDTYKTGQIFNISPPRFVDVVKKRLELSLEALSSEAPEQIKFQSRSGITFSYPKSRAGEFLRAIYFELFQRSNNISRVLEALAGRNVRRALDMFNAIITSGHMPEDIIASIAQGGTYRSFPEYRIVRALMRQDYRFFNHYAGFVANIFNGDSRWERPNNLLISEILFHLISLRKVRGDNGQMGFVAVRRVLDDLGVMGFVANDVMAAAIFCLEKGLIEVDTSSTLVIRPQDSLKATSSGWAHMRILSSRVEYLSAILPTTPVNDKSMSARIFDLMQIENRTGQTYLSQQVRVVVEFEAYIRRQYEALRAHPGYGDASRTGANYVLGKMQEALTYARRDARTITGQADLLDH